MSERFGEPQNGLNRPSRPGTCAGALDHHPARGDEGRDERAALEALVGPRGEAVLDAGEGLEKVAWHSAPLWQSGAHVNRMTLAPWRLFSACRNAATASSPFRFR